jgi:hypothetical protein
MLAIRRADKLKRANLSNRQLFFDYFRIFYIEMFILVRDRSLLKLD